MKIFKVFNPYSGLYTDALSPAELLETLAKEAWEAYLVLTHGQPFSVVEVNADGSQTWRSANGDPQMSPEEVQERMKKLAENTFGNLPLTVME
jgi:hypothetical protein